MPIFEAVAIPFVRKHMPDAQTFEPDSTITAAAQGMLAALARWEPAMRQVRAAV